MSNQLIPVPDAVIVRQDNIATIVNAGPQSYQSNALSCQRCFEAGQQLLGEIERCGMSDDLDRRLAAYLEKTRRTVKAMNERRSPVTKLFDQIRAEFTALESTVDPAKKDTVPFLIQQARNAYAARKRQEEERRRAADLAAQEVIRAKENYRIALEEDYRRSFNNLVASSVRDLSDMAASLTLDNYTAILDTVTGTPSELAPGWQPFSNICKPHNISPDEASTIRTEVLAALRPGFSDRFAAEVGIYRHEILDKLPSKRVELERIAEADAAEAARLKAEVARREAEEAARKEQERLKAEEEAKKKAELDRNNAEISGLFAMAKAEAGYTPKSKVSKKIKINDPSAFLGIVSLWWQREGCTLSVDELAKIFKKQISFCEKLATKEDVFVESAGLEYYDDVKAQ